MSDLPVYEPIDHTADAGFRVRGATLPELFTNAARCLLEMLGESAGVAPERAHEVELAAEGHAALLRAWLSELLYISYVKRLVVSGVEIQELTESSMRARATGETYDEARHERHAEIKAVTWHDLAVRRTGTGWEGVFILDL